MNHPDFYDPQRVGELYAPNVQAAVNAGRAAAFRPTEQVRTLLLLVDMQVDFVHVDGSLSVPGAVDDTRRVIEWIFRNAGDITTIAASLDSHTPIQIFFPTWWVDADGNHPQPYTVIRSADVASGKWRPLYEPEWSLEYCQRLEAQAKKELMIWTFHTLVGTTGHALTPALYEAIAYHAAARQAQPLWLEKGMIPKTEHYSILEPEVKVSDHPAGGLNVAYLNMLASYDRVYLAGEAKSHCVLETVASVVRHFRNQPDVIAKFHVLTDCMSSVAHPAIDFEALASRQFEALATQGLQLVESTAPLS